MTGYRPPPPPPVTVQLEALRAEFPAYDINLVRDSGRELFECRRVRGGTGPRKVAAGDARVVWRALGRA